MKEIEKMNAGEEYFFLDEEITEWKARAARLYQEFNKISSEKIEDQIKKIKEMFGSTGDNISVQTGFNCDYGNNIHVGEDFLSNYNLTILDIAPVKIGKNVMNGPNVDIYTVNHPINKEGRRNYKAYALPVNIGDDVWIGGKKTILPGVTIGDNVIVAAGSVVTKNIEDNTIVAGVPATIIKKLD